jgi:CheY-like chemotaxis protein/predicted  nucleic acid-binding Zn-ribbon protein
MTTKVLVFESDAAFAGELRNELGKLGCTTNIVEDGNVGLQQAAADKPDLILLSIELPRMNGFSVCNKLKKDAALKDIPLIIMSSGSSDETFDQHRKLRTRAEDYVHKPISFGELVQRIQPFVPLATSTGYRQSARPTTDDIAIDDEIGLDDMVEEQHHVPVETTPEDLEHGDTQTGIADMDMLTDEAFHRITGGESTNGASANPPALAGSFDSLAAGLRPRDPPVIPSAPPERRASVRPTFDERTKERVAELENEVANLKRENGRLKDDLLQVNSSEAETGRLQREVDDLKARLASKGGGVSSREFLDLRENLNKKDKEILSLKESLSKKDREIVEARDKSLALERAKQENDDGLLTLERELADANDKIDQLTADKEQAKKASEDHRTRMQRAVAESEQRAAELEELRTKYAEDMARHERDYQQLDHDHRAQAEVSAQEAQQNMNLALEGARAEHERAVASLKSRHSTELSELDAQRVREVEGIEFQRQAELEQLRREVETRLQETEENALRDRAQAVADRETELREQHRKEFTAYKTAREEEIYKLRSDNEQEVNTLREQAAADLAEAESRREGELDAERRVFGQRLKAREREMEDAKEAAVLSLGHEKDTVIASIERDRNETIARMERERDERIANVERARDQRIEELTAHFEARAADAEGNFNDRVRDVENDRDAKITALEAKALRDLDDERGRSADVKAGLDREIEGLRSELQNTREQLSAVTSAKREGDTQNSARIAELEKEVAIFRSQRDDLTLEVARLRGRLDEADTDRTDLRTELEAVREKLSNESARFERASAKMHSDRASLERAKDALAVVLAQIDEVEERSF